MNIFYSDNIQSYIISLDKVETNHCIKVLRNNIGDEVLVTDGMGFLYTCIIKEVKNKCAFLEVIKKKENKKKYFIHIAISPIKNHERLEWFVEKSVEIGIDRISFIKCERTVRKNIRMRRLKKIAITAMKQSLKTKIPVIDSMINIEDFLKSCNTDNRFICYLSKDKSHMFDKKIHKDRDICILIGPEGDFSNKEVDLALSQKFRTLSLGDNRLRTETAGIIACHLANIVVNK